MEIYTIDNSWTMYIVSHASWSLSCSKVTNGKFFSSPLWALVVIAEFLSKPSPLQFTKCAAIYPDYLHVKGVKKTASVQNISPTSGLPTSTTPTEIDIQHRYDEVEDCERDIITRLCSVINFNFTSLSHTCRAQMQFFVGGKREKHGESANSTYTFLLRYCEACAANDIAMSVNSTFSMFLVRLSLLCSLSMRVESTT